MPEPVEDLWPANLFKVDDPAPVVFLKKQAGLLEGRTGGLVEGMVRENVLGGTVWYSLYLRAVGGDDYMFKILSVFYPMDRGTFDPYPFTAIDSFAGEEFTVTDLGAFKDWLKSVLASESVRTVIGNLARNRGNLVTSQNDPGA